MSPARAAARRYLEIGLNPIPITPGGHQPLVKWKAYQTTRVTEREIDNWYHRWPTAGVGIITGRVSSLVVLDQDPRNGPGLALDDATCPIVATPGGGYHFYYAYDPMVTTAHPLGQGTPYVARGLDVQSDRAYVIAPPSVRRGKVYHFVDHTEQMLEDLPPLPVPIVARMRAAKARDHLLLPRGSIALPTTGSRTGGVDLDTALRVLKVSDRHHAQTWMARCPLHDDTKPSLAISTGTDGRLLLYCHAGCSFTKLIAYLTQHRTPTTQPLLVGNGCTSSEVTR